MQERGDRVFELSDSLIMQDVDLSFKGAGYLEKGITLSKQGDSQQSIEQLKKALAVFEELGDKKSVSHTLKVLGNVSFFSNSMMEARHYFKMALDFPEKNNDEAALAGIYANLSRTYGTYEEIDSAIYYNDKVLKIAYKNKQVNEIAYLAYQNDADYKGQLNRYDEALTSIDSAYAIAQVINHPGMLAAAHQVKSTIYGHMNQPLRAIDEAEKAYEIFKKNGFQMQAIQTIGLLHGYYASSNQMDKAYTYLKQLKVFTDSLNSLEIDQSLKGLRVKYNTAENELKIAQQEAEIIKRENQKNVLVLLVIMLTIVSLLIIIVYKQQQKNQKQKIQALEQEQENVALKSLMTGEEKERARISKELHDGIGSMLAASKMLASASYANVASENGQKLIDLIDNASKETRRISHNLLPESLLNKGLDIALQDFVSAINDSKQLKATYQAIQLSDDLPQGLQLTVYRIIQELINNIIKHSGATEAIVQINQHNKTLVITVEDNGKGFNYIKDKKGIGLLNIESRLSLVRGKMEVDSSESLGTSVYIELEL